MGGGLEILEICWLINKTERRGRQTVIFQTGAQRPAQMKGRTKRKVQTGKINPQTTSPRNLTYGQASTSAAHDQSAARKQPQHPTARLK